MKLKDSRMARPILAVGAQHMRNGKPGGLPAPQDRLPTLSECWGVSQDAPFTNLEVCIRV